MVAQIAADLRTARHTADLEQIERIAARVVEAARAILPRTPHPSAEPRTIAPREDDDAYLFENPLWRARVRPDGTIFELQGQGSRNAVTGAGVLRAYKKRAVPVKPQSCELDDDGLAIRYRIGRSTIVTRMSRPSRSSRNARVKPRTANLDAM